MLGIFLLIRLHLGIRPMWSVSNNAPADGFKSGFDRDCWRPSLLILIVCGERRFMDHIFFSSIDA